MKTKLLSLMFLFGAFTMNAQETHMINWFFNVPAAQASMTINQGDTVMWMLTDAMPHTVETSAGAVESFASGNLNAGTTYSHTFNTVGAVPYICAYHSNMRGTITVSAVAGVKDVKTTAIKFFPNPVNDILTINAKDVVDQVSVYDLTGRQVLTSVASTTVVKLYMDNYPSGTYVVKVTSAGKTESMKVVKQ
ncbi:T9SS type A sorting domain-containing protein [Flavobacterium rivuli]|uniref:T9SS type A sorting domain-containing protein n=1 Tax=Flavobacterium rivuli TaxID=498301 RepID=UPI0003682EF3|nr:T9SS type A sorting domain-containing protein [Flavobacterium rivuli]